MCHYVVLSFSCSGTQVKKTSMQKVFTSVMENLHIKIGNLKVHEALCCSACVLHIVVLHVLSCTCIVLHIVVLHVLYTTTTSCTLSCTCIVLHIVLYRWQTCLPASTPRWCLMLAGPFVHLHVQLVVLVCVCVSMHASCLVNVSVCQCVFAC